MRKILYKFAVALQWLLITVSIINLLYCAITGEEILFIGTYCLLVIPYLRICAYGRIFDALALLVFLLISIFLVIYSTRDFLNDEAEKSWALMANFVWFTYSLLFCWAFADLYTMDKIQTLKKFEQSMLFDDFIWLFVTIVTFIKFCDMHRNMHSKSGADLTPTKNQWHCVSYNQIQRTALGSPVIIGICSFVGFTIKYLGSPLATYLINVFNSFALFCSVVIFFGTIYETNRFEKRTGQKPPKKNFLMKLNIIQVCSMIFLALSYLLVTFVF